MTAIGIRGARRTTCAASLFGASLLALLAAAPAAADIAVSQLVVEFRPGTPKAADIEIANSGEEPSYVVVEPREVVHAGMPN